MRRLPQERLGAVDQRVLAQPAGTPIAVDAAKAKWWTAQVHNDVLDACVPLHGDACLPLHGGDGSMIEHRLAPDWRDARLTQVRAGSNEIMKESIGRDLGL